MKVKNFKMVIALILAAIIAVMMFGTTSNVFATENVVGEGEGEAAAEYLAEVDGQKYEDFWDGFKAARANNKTVKLLGDYVDTPGHYGVPSGCDVTIDLNGNNLTIDGFRVYGGKLTLTGEGTIFLRAEQQVLMEGTDEEVSEYSTLNVDSGVTLCSVYEGTGWVIVHNSNYSAPYGVKVNFNGKIEGKTSANEVIGLYVSGNLQDTNGVFTIGNSAVINCSRGIYAAGDATWNFSGKIDAEENGIEIRAGELNVTGGSISVKKIPTQVEANGNGTTTDGAAIAVAQHTTKLPIDVKVSGGTFTAFTPFNQTNPQKNGEEDIAKVKIQITGGTFRNIDNSEHKPTYSAYSENYTNFISGGTFDLMLPEGETGYIAEGYEQYMNSDETVTVLPVSKITFDKVETMKVGDVHDLNAKVSVAACEKYYKFIISGEEGILKIEDGKLVALKPGKVAVVASGPRNGDFFEVVVYDVAAENTEEATVTATSVANDVIAEVLDNPEEDVVGVSEETKEAIIEAVEAGKTIVVEVETEEAKPEEAEIKLIEEKLDGSKVAGYFDINVVLKVDNEKIGKLTELGKKIEVELPVPKDEPEVATGFVRTYSVIRIHNGKAEVIAEGLTAKNGKISVASDKFSTYAMAYTDTVATNPKTGDAVTLVVASMIVAMAGIVVTRKIRK